MRSYVMALRKSRSYTIARRWQPRSLARKSVGGPLSHTHIESGCFHSSLRAWTVYPKVLTRCGYSAERLLSVTKSSLHTTCSLISSRPDLVPASRQKMASESWPRTSEPYLRVPAQLNYCFDGAVHCGTFRLTPDS